MISEDDGGKMTEIYEAIRRLQSPISNISDLLSLLSRPLDIIGLLPPLFSHLSTSRFASSARDSFQILKYVPTVQTTILGSIAPTWLARLRDQGYDDILYQYFVPDAFSSSSQAAGEVALCAYLTILSSPLASFSVDLLRRLSRHYPIDRLHATIFAKDSSIPPHKKLSTWEDVVQRVISAPTKAANQSDRVELPQELYQAQYYFALCERFEILIASCPQCPSSEVIPSLTLLLTKLINVGLFPSTTSITPSETSFPSVTLPAIRTRIARSLHITGETYAATWNEVFSSLPTTLFSKVLASFVANLSEFPAELDTSDESRGLVKREAVLLSRLFGILEGNEDEKWLSISSVFLTRTWSIAKSRMLVCWAIVSDDKVVPSRAVKTLINQIMEVWSSGEHIKHSLLSHHQYLTTALLLAVYALPASHAALQSLAFSSAFIDSISQYISHLDPAVRRCGMLAAELVAERTSKKLDFKQWDGEGEGREWARAVRRLIARRDADVEEVTADVIRLEQMETDEPRPQRLPMRPESDASRVQLVETAYDSDNDLEGYVSSPASSRSPSPTQEELEELEEDPTIHVGRKKIQRPVYLLDLSQLITNGGKSDDAQNADRIQMALDCAEELIRRKKGFGFELEENAVNLVCIFAGLQNNYELEGFDQKRQAALRALVACCPKKAAPAIMDEFFKNQYSTDQRFVMLNALALSARELARLPIPNPVIAAGRTVFPSKQLPPALHQKYIAYEEANGAEVQRMLEDISQAAIESGKTAAELKVPPIVRERQLRIKQPARVTEVKPGSTYVPAESRFSELAAEYFVGPLVGKFWMFLRDEQEREARTAHRTTTYRGTGTGLILSPMVLAHFLGTVAILMHAARHSPAYLAVLAPDALELAVTLGTRPMSSAEEDEAREASVLTAALELAVIILDGCLELDGGRSLCLEHAALLLGTGEWATEVMNALERGVRVPGGGGTHEAKLRRSAAGVVLKVDELVSRWRQSMISPF